MAAIKVMDGKDLNKATLGDVAVGSRYKTDNLFGKPVNPGDKIKINDIEVRVIAVMAPIGNPSDDQNIYMFMDTFEKIFGKTDRVDQIVVQIQQGENINDVSARVDEKLAKFRNVKKPNIDFTILTPEELLASFGIILNILTAFLVGIAAISLVVGAIGIANTMYTSVLERTQEIGTMKAVGARNEDIQTIFLIESGMLGLIGGLVGVVLGIIVSKIIEKYAAVALGSNFLQASFPWYLIIGALLFGFLIGAGAGWLPARQASKLNPTEALRYE
jgi:putative ABC transport system permease protein